MLSPHLHRKQSLRPLRRTCSSHLPLPMRCRRELAMMRQSRIVAEDKRSFQDTQFRFLNICGRVAFMGIRALISDTPTLRRLRNLGSASSQALAIFQSRHHTLGEIFNISTFSSTLNPPKNRSSTTLACVDRFQRVHSARRRRSRFPGLSSSEALSRCVFSSRFTWDPTVAAFGHVALRRADPPGSASSCLRRQRRSARDPAS